MYLKSLEIQGFKSFPDKTFLQFGDDITAIVGPNGSGKSNISDAIRWVMGEQSTRALRGGKMEDVIFGGTQKRAQVGFAEASLVLDNTDRAFAVDADEVMVTRRYYRSGESEYYINKQSARLRDINELFMDTGLGKEGYSNISQGRIDEILSLKSTDRREIFEEAAGISKYRHRKEETERRLERTEDNLLRIGDKISELELQIEPLREQAEKAKKYLAFRDELKGLEVALWVQSLERLAQTAQKAEEDYRSATFILQQEHDALEALYQSSEALTAQLREEDQILDQRRGEIELAKAEAQRLEGELALRRSEEKNVTENIDRLNRELSEQDSRSGGVLAEMEERRARIREIDAQTKTLETQLQDLSRQVEALTESAEGMTRQYLELQQSQAACTAEIAGKQADLAALSGALERAGARREELTADRDSAKSRRAETEARLSDCRARLRAARDSVQSQKNTISGYTLRQKARREKADTLAAGLRELGVNLDTAASKLRLLREMEREYEGFSKAVRFVMQESGSGRLGGIHGPVSRLIQTDDKFSVAMEIALGAAMQHIVVGTEQDGKAAIGQLKNRDQGRATFLPLSTIRGSVLQERGLDQCRGFLGVASSLVRCQDRYRPVVESLLGRTVICQSLDDAIAMSRQYRSRFKIVTLDGQVMNAGGSMTGGSVSRSAGVLSRANEIQRLQVKVRELEGQKLQQQKELAEAQRQAEQVSFELQTAQDQLREQEDLTLRLEGEEKQYAVLFEAIVQAASANDRELDQLKAQTKADLARQDSLTKDLRTLKATQADLTARLEVLSLSQEDVSGQSGSLMDRTTQLKMDIAGLAAEKLTAMDALRSLSGLSQAMEGDRNQKTDLIAAFEGQILLLQGQMDQLQARIRAQQDTVSQRQQALEQAQAHRAGVEAKRTATDRDAQQKNKDIIDMEREVARLEARKNNAELEEKQIIDKLWESYELTPSTAPAQAAKIESVQAATKRSAELRRKIHSLGTPNLGAIDEYARVSERYEYLTGQRDDVLQSKKELEAIIRDITRHMTDIFTEEFAKINTYFGQTFTEMFGGGKGSLELEDPAEPLTCGIEIKVQPPGKQLKTITLLSGGEKAFVAIALYFAILKVRPTPFCMLDEIDAALDDRNVERYASYLRQLCKKTQFIVITPRRGTMEEADALFGVTMQEQGVSKILHLDLNQLTEQLGITE